MVIVSNDQQLPKPDCPICFRFMGKSIDVNLEHPEKVPSSIIVTPSGIVIEVRFLQPEKALPPIEVTSLGILIEVKQLQPEYL